MSGRIAHRPRYRTLTSICHPHLMLVKNSFLNIGRIAARNRRLNDILLATAFLSSPLAMLD